MKQILTTLARSDQGQDLIEYTLLIAFIMMATYGYADREWRRRTGHPDSDHDQPERSE